VPLNSKVLIALVAGLLVGFAAGYVVTDRFKEAEPAAPTSSAPVMTAPSLGAAPAGAPAGANPNALTPELASRISQAQAAVLANPKDHGAWVSLGNDYFDSQQFQKSVEAYDKALALQPNDPNVLTDQGVMYRNLGQFEKALANFQKANKLDPSHVQSLFNVGVVYDQDLNKPAEAAKVWKKVLTLAPNSNQAAQARQMLSQQKK
jgi:tetratricopeptide (TPR) repeat protein